MNIAQGPFEKLIRKFSRQQVIGKSGKAEDIDALHDWLNTMGSMVISVEKIKSLTPKGISYLVLLNWLDNFKSSKLMKKTKFKDLIAFIDVLCAIKCHYPYAFTKIVEDLRTIHRIYGWNQFPLDMLLFMRVQAPADHWRKICVTVFGKECTDQIGRRMPKTIGHMWTVVKEVRYALSKF